MTAGTLISLLPFSFREVFASSNTFVFYNFIPIRKKIARMNLNLAFPDKEKKQTDEILRNCCRNFFLMIFELFHFKRMNPENLECLINFPNTFLIDNNRKNGKGVILMSAHFSNWELSAFALGVLFKPISVIVKEQSNKYIDRYINNLRSLKGNKMVYMNNTREVLSGLKNNEVIAMLSDQSAPGENTRVKFFIDDVPVFDGAARFAIKTGCPVLFGLCVRNPDKTYKFEFEEMPVFTNSSEFMQHYCDRLRSYIERYPEQWLWFHKRFKQNIKYP